MSNRVGQGLDNFEPPDSRDTVMRDGFVEHAAMEAWMEKESAHNFELDEMIAMGWGATEQRKIPADWRARMGPDSPERRELQRSGIIRAQASRRITQRFNVIAPSRSARKSEIARRAKRVETSKNNAG